MIEFLFEFFIGLNGLPGPEGARGDTGAPGFGLPGERGEDGVPGYVSDSI